ncbi:hypothetical protein SODG_006080 [Sodalis praecaptivus]
MSAGVRSSTSRNNRSKSSPESNSKYGNKYHCGSNSPSSYGSGCFTFGNIFSLK